MASRIYRRLPLPVPLPAGAVRERIWLAVGDSLAWGQVLLTLQRDIDVLNDTAQLFLALHLEGLARRFVLQPVRMRQGITVDPLATAEIPGAYPHAVLLEFRSPVRDRAWIPRRAA